MRRAAFAAVAMLAVALPALGQAPAAPYAPFVNDSTFLVARADLAQIDADAMFDLVLDQLWRMGGQTGPRPADAGQGQSPVLEGIEQARQQGRQQLQAWRQAGGREVYVVISAENPLPLLIAPVAPDADAQAIGAFLGQVQGPVEAVAQAGNVVVAGPQEALTFARSISPSPRPEFERILNAPGEAQVRIAVVPTEAMRQQALAGLQQASIEDLPPALAEHALPAVEGFRWGAVAITLPPQLRVRVVLQSADAASAQRTREAIEQVVELLRQGGYGELPVFGPLMAMLMPQVQGSMLVTTLDQEQLLQLSEPLLASLQYAREQAKVAVSAANLNAIGMGMHVYASEHDGQLPPDLQTLVDARLMGSRAGLSSPRASAPQPISYEYRPPARTLEGLTDPQAVVAFEKFDTWPELGVPVLFGDLHVEVIQSQEQFQRLLRGGQ